jgi:hypothetical protein
MAVHLVHPLASASCGLTILSRLTKSHLAQHSYAAPSSKNSLVSCPPLSQLGPHIPLQASRNSDPAHFGRQRDLTLRLGTSHSLLLSRFLGCSSKVSHKPKNKAGKRSVVFAAVRERGGRKGGKGSSAGTKTRPTSARPKKVDKDDDHGGGGRAAMPSQQAKLAAMREFEQDEKLMFNVVPAGRDAIQCVYAYPNTYTVGICSLGYQLVRVCTTS